MAEWIVLNSPPMVPTGSALNALMKFSFGPSFRGEHGSKKLPQALGNYSASLTDSPRHCPGHLSDSLLKLQRAQLERMLRG